MVLQNEQEKVAFFLCKFPAVVEVQATPHMAVYGQFDHTNQVNDRQRVEMNYSSFLSHEGSTKSTFFPPPTPDTMHPVSRFLLNLTSFPPKHNICY